MLRKATAPKPTEGSAPSHIVRKREVSASHQIFPLLHPETLAGGVLRNADALGSRVFRKADDMLDSESLAEFLPESSFDLFSLVSERGSRLHASLVSSPKAALPVQAYRVSPLSLAADFRLQLENWFFAIPEETASEAKRRETVALSEVKTGLVSFEGGRPDTQTAGEWMMNRFLPFGVHAKFEEGQGAEVKVEEAEPILRGAPLELGGGRTKMSVTRVASLSSDIAKMTFSRPAAVDLIALWRDPHRGRARSGSDHQQEMSKEEAEKETAEQWRLRHLTATQTDEPHCRLTARRFALRNGTPPGGPDGSPPVAAGEIVWSLLLEDADFLPRPGETWQIFDVAGYASEIIFSNCRGLKLGAVQVSTSFYDNAETHKRPKLPSEFSSDTWALTPEFMETADRVQLHAVPSRSGISASARLYPREAGTMQVGEAFLGGFQLRNHSQYLLSQLEKEATLKIPTCAQLLFDTAALLEDFLLNEALPLPAGVSASTLISEAFFEDSIAASRRRQQGMDTADDDSAIADLEAEGEFLALQMDNLAAAHERWQDRKDRERKRNRQSFLNTPLWPQQVLSETKEEEGEKKECCADPSEYPENPGIILTPQEADRLHTVLLDLDLGEGAERAFSIPQYDTAELDTWGSAWDDSANSGGSPSSVWSLEGLLDLLKGGASSSSSAGLSSHSAPSGDARRGQEEIETEKEREIRLLKAKARAEDGQIFEGLWRDRQGISRKQAKSVVLQLAEAAASLLIRHDEEDVISLVDEMSDLESVKGPQDLDAVVTRSLDNYLDFLRSLAPEDLNEEALSFLRTGSLSFNPYTPLETETEVEEEKRERERESDLSNSVKYEEYLGSTPPMQSFAALAEREVKREGDVGHQWAKLAESLAGQSGNQEHPWNTNTDKTDNMWREILAKGWVSESTAESDEDEESTEEGGTDEEEKEEEEAEVLLMPSLSDLSSSHLSFPSHSGSDSSSEGGGLAPILRSLEEIFSEEGGEHLDAFIETSRAVVAKALQKAKRRDRETVRGEGGEEEDPLEDLLLAPGEFIREMREAQQEALEWLKTQHKSKEALVQTIKKRQERRERDQTQHSDATDPATKVWHWIQSQFLQTGTGDRGAGDEDNSDSEEEEEGDHEEVFDPTYIEYDFDLTFD
uniref:Uncharacterized protein n=1 Tax=Chromera velia CCMP2878 TaxID=1169474 RepID=A0A0G4HCY5_9ALVE|eukprot:Cvel_6377.t1-p1 / transcript=Cvel_6377.t1 / gene=Cvel_6377 / organism=Chromera_velia_CCMP2878 / gene_product=hypothetical protein / transcript_product=hypothetical protein / location=Cvel_scaffold310:82303-89304(-) / protein_length=1143 / sequence_SO=supercontig / SO=protein_coding / is_pseudo=false